MSTKIALITGITGQDGSYLAEFLLSKGYDVHGITRRTSTTNLQRITHILTDITIHDGDISDISSLMHILTIVKPMEIYNLAAQSHVHTSFTNPIVTANVNAIGVLNLLEAARKTLLVGSFKIYQASTSEMFGKVVESPQSEHTPFYPRSPYGVSKLMAHWSIINYREAYDIFACNGILFNHESPRRGTNFVTRKISMAAAAISKGKQKELFLGNLDSKRDWGHARDYVECMWMMLNNDKPEDFIIATGETTTVREFVKLVFKVVNIPIIFEGDGVDEVGLNANTGDVVIRIDSQFMRPSEVDVLIGDPTNAITTLKWNPRKTSLDELVREMVQNDLDIIDI